jgi:hypothetical protein
MMTKVSQLHTNSHVINMKEKANADLEIEVNQKRRLGELGFDLDQE